LVKPHVSPERLVPRTAGPDERPSTDVGTSTLVTRGLILLLCLFVFLEVQPYRLPSGARTTYPVFIFISVLLLIFFRRRLLNNLRSGVNWPVVIFATYVIWILISSLWSYRTFTSLAQSAPVIATLLIAICFSHISSTATAKSLVIVGVSVALCSWIMFLIAPSSAVIPDVVWRLNGPLMHSQRLALLMGFSLVCLASLILNKEPSTTKVPKYVLTMGTVLLVGTLVATNARAFTAFTLITVLLLVFVRMHLGARVLFGLIAALAAVLILLSWQELFSLVARGTRDQTLTGRLPLWAFTIDMISQRPLQGFGFAMFGSELTRPATDVWVAPHAHNTWLNAAFETGIIGAALLTLFLGACLVTAIRAPRSRGASFSYLLGPTVLTILCGTTGLLVGGRLTTPYALLLLLAAQVAREATLERTERRIGREISGGLETVGRRDGLPDTT
jgi:O-antigen ligase